MNALARAEILSRYQQHVERFEQHASSRRRLALSGPVSEPTQVASGSGVLTPRERTILELVAEGLSDSEIGAECGISAPTVKTHLRHLYVKLAARNRAHAVAIGAANGLLRLPVAA